MGLVTRRYRLLSLVVVFAVSLLIAPSLFASSGEAQEQQSNEKKQPLNSLMQKRSANDADSNTAGQQLPQLFYPEETHDFGAVERGSKLVHLFKVQNTGDAPLRIFNAKGSWGCTAAIVDTTAIPPGGEGQIEVTLDVGNYTGELTKSIRVTSSDPRRRTSTIHVRAMIELDFDFVTSSLYFGRISPADRITKSSFLQVKEPAETEILDIKSSSPLISVRKVGYGDTEESKRSFEIEVTIEPGLPVGQFVDSVIVHSNLKRKPTTTLRVLGLVFDGVEVNPQTLTFMVSEKETTDRTRTKTVYITNFQKKIPLEILEVIDEDDHVEVEISPTEEDQKFKLTITLTEEDVPETGNLNGTIKIITNNPQFKELMILYSAVWRN